MSAYGNHSAYDASSTAATSGAVVVNGYDSSAANNIRHPMPAVSVDGYGAHGDTHTTPDDSTSYLTHQSSAYSAYAESSVPTAAAAIPLTYAARTPAQTHALMRGWESSTIFPWASTRLSEAAHIVMSQSHSTGLDHASSSSSYRWRQLRWTYLQAYPKTSWNSLYQKLFESVAVNAYDVKEKTRQQEELLSQFVQFSRNTVELIMEEVHLPAAITSADPNMPAPDPEHLHTKFLSPLAVGGVAGGEKYIFNGVLFKFARDWAGLFGATVDFAGAGGHGSTPSTATPSLDHDMSSDEFVQKSAANEIRHMNALIALDGPVLIQAPLFLTMSCLFRLRGSVVMCTALAPIAGRSSLVYGSADAGHTIRYVPEETPVIGDLAQRWHLAPHPVMDAQATKHILPLATDIEVHASPTDGRMYMLDLARFLPPTPPTPRTMEHLYFMFRPEFMRRNLLGLNNKIVSSGGGGVDPSPFATALSPDAFSGFGNLDALKFNPLVQSNYRHMKYECVPKAAEKLQEWFDTAVRNGEDFSVLASEGSQTLGARIAQVIHECGVNVRYLALVRSMLPPPPSPATSTSGDKITLSTLLLCDMVSRTVKQLYFAWVRRMMLSVGRAVDEETMDAATTATASTSSAPGGQSHPRKVGWTEVDLERWRHRASASTGTNAASASDEIDESNDQVSTSHHESSLLFALLLSLLFTPLSSTPSSPSFERSQSFWTQLLWPSIQNKFGKWTFGAVELGAYETELNVRGLAGLSPEVRTRVQQVDVLIGQTEVEALRRECAEFIPSTDNNSSLPASAAPILLRLVCEAVGFDFFAVRHTLSKLDCSVANPIALVRHLVPLVNSFSDDGPSRASSLTPLDVTSIFMLSFAPSVQNVNPLPFISLAESELSLLSTVQTRASRMGANHPALLGALWALVDVYEAQMEEVVAPKPAAAAVAGSLIPAAAPVATKAPYEKGVAVLTQIESIFQGILSSSDSIPSTLSLISYSKFGWFHLKFGHLHQAQQYFEKDYARRMEAVKELECKEGVGAETSGSSTGTAISPALSSALLSLASSIEALGIIHRELGESPETALKEFQTCLETYERVHGKLDAPLLDSDSSSDSDSPSTAFRTSITLATLYTNLANSHGACGDFAAKRSFLEKAKKIMLDHHSSSPTAGGDGSGIKPHPNLIAIQINLASCFTQAPQASQEEIVEAKKMLEQCVEWTRILYPSPPLASTVNVQGQQQQPRPQEHHSLASIYSALASVEGKLGDQKRKVALLEQSIHLATAQYGAIHPEVAVIQTNLGLAYGAAGEVVKGLQMLQQALSVKTKIYGSPMHNEVAITLSNMSVLYAQAGDWKQEFRSLQQALQIFMGVLQKQAAAARTFAAAPTVGAPPASIAPVQAPPANASALASNPHLLFTQQRFFRAKQSMVQREKDVAGKQCCSFLATGTNRTTQAWFKCVTCSPNLKSTLGVCAVCVRRCHVGHEIQPQEPAAFYCDCGEGVFPKPCQALVEEKQQEQTAIEPVPAATPSSSAPVSSPPFDLTHSSALASGLFELVQQVLRPVKLSHYARDCTKDLLLLIFGLRSSFIVDVFAPSIDVWRQLIAGVEKILPEPNSIGILDLCDAGVVLFNRKLFHSSLLKHQSELSAAAPSSSVSVSGSSVEFVNVHPSVSEPIVLEGELRATFRKNLLTLTQELLKQMESNVAILSLPSPELLDHPFAPVINSLSLTTICGFLLGYPILYCTPSDDGASAGATQGNNLSMKPLTRFVYTTALRPEVEQTSAFKFLVESTSKPSAGSASSSSNASSPSTILVCSFTVPTSLVVAPHVVEALASWTATKKTPSILLPHLACWDAERTTITTESVTLPVVAL